MRKTTFIKAIGIITVLSLGVPSIATSAQSTSASTVQEITQQENSHFMGNLPDNMQNRPGGWQNDPGMSSYEISETASDIITSSVICTASDLIADHSSASTITISDTNCQIKISEAGTYIVTGSCSNGNITVKKGTTGVVLILKDLELTSTTGATVSINKQAEAKIIIEGTVTLTDAENPDDENSTDTEIADAFDGAAIKVKDGANAYITGTGKLIINGNCKNGIKSGDEEGTCLVVNGPDITITAANDGFNAGYDLTILSGNLTISAADDAIHDDRILTIGSADTDGPDITIKSCKEGLEGTVVNVYSGKISLTASDDGINAANSDGTYASEMAYSINIMGGTISVNASGDGLDSNGNINLIAGTISIKSASDGGEAGIDFDGSYYVSSDVVLNNQSGVSGPDMMPGQMGQGFQPGFDMNSNTQNSPFQSDLGNNIRNPFGNPMGTPPSDPNRNHPNDSTDNPLSSSADKISIETDSNSQDTASTVVFKNVKKTITEAFLETSKKSYSIIKTSGGGNVSVVKYYKNAANYIKVSSKGKVTVKKGTPAGTYKIKIKVAATDGYPETTKVIKIKVK